MSPNAARFACRTVSITLIMVCATSIVAKRPSHHPLPENHVLVRVQAGFVIVGAVRLRRFLRVAVRSAWVHVSV
jgi:hypothetical protein